MSAAACAKRILNGQTLALLENWLALLPVEVSAGMATALAVDEELDEAPEDLIMKWIDEERKLTDYMLGESIGLWELRRRINRYIENMRKLPLEGEATGGAGDVDASIANMPPSAHDGDTGEDP
jgi:hypothetical protein